MKPSMRRPTTIVGAVVLALVGSALLLPRSGLGSAPPEGSSSQFQFKRTSGLFSLPQNAVSVDWVVLNDGPVAQQVRVTVFKVGAGVKTSQGAVVATVNPNSSFHNANGVGVGKPFTVGFYYEVVVESTNAAVHPSVQVWSNQANAVIPGTLIPPGDFVPLM